MASGSVAAIAAGICFLVAALGYMRANRAAPSWAQFGTWMDAAGTAILAGALCARGLQAGHWPLTSQYEFALAFALGTALATLTVGSRRGGHSYAVQATTMIVAAATVAYARLGMPLFKRAIQPLPPALRSFWLPLHVGAAALAYGALEMGGAAGFVWLVHKSDRAETGKLLDRAVAAGYPLLTLSMLLGMIWAQAAWGRYWGWDLKEVWTLITWLIYTLYWHLRRRPRWQERWIAWLALTGLGAVWFTFLGVSGLARRVGLRSLHLF